ncbi:MAG: glycogen synthase GlgA [Verrucomicrobiota bacterium]|nr:glycogen synthase GlgA [Verrucomicrobiota bacterium]
MKILFIGAEAAPYVKVGGLADVVGALPKELARLGHDVRVVCPLYGSIRRGGQGWLAHDAPLFVKIGPQDHVARVWEHHPADNDSRFYFIEYNEYFGRNEVYDGPWGPHQDNDRRYGFLGRVGIDLCHWLDWVPDVIHCHDWSSALAPVYLNSTEKNTALRNVASVITIHNLQHQGYAHRDLLEWARLPAHLFTADNLESMGALNLLKGGLYHATKITTVSPTYAQEIQGWPGGCGLEEILRFRAGDLIGILNGIDTTVWNPSQDPYLPAHFDPGGVNGKALCKQALQTKLHLHTRREAPLFGVVSRLFEQKGLDLLQAIAARLLTEQDIQIVVLGTGDHWLEEAFRNLGDRFPGRFCGYIGFDEQLAHLIYAGCDFFLMPSRFEPCGLGQMYAMAYGTPPIARATGGLVDTVKSLRDDAATATGFLFSNPDAESLYQAMLWAIHTFYEQPTTLQRLRLNGMLTDFSWRHSAQLYADVYRWAIEQRHGAAVRAG